MDDKYISTTKNIESWITAMDEEIEEINKDCESLSLRVKDFSEAFEELRKEIFKLTRGEENGKERK